MCISRGNLHVSSHNVMINFLAIFLQMCSKQNVALHHILTDFQLRGSNNDSAKQTLQKSSSHIFSEIDYCFMTFCSSMSVIVKIRVDGKIFITFISISGSNPRSHWIPQLKQLFWGCLIFYKYKREIIVIDTFLAGIKYIKHKDMVKDTISKHCTILWCLAWTRLFK